MSACNTYFDGRVVYYNIFDHCYFLSPEHTVTDKTLVQSSRTKFCVKRLKIDPQKCNIRQIKEALKSFLTNLSDLKSDLFFHLVCYRIALGLLTKSGPQLSPIFLCFLL